MGLGFHLLLLDSIFWGLYIFWSLSLFSLYFFLNKYKHAQVYSGHLYVCATVALVEFLLFRELSGTPDRIALAPEETRHARARRLEDGASAAVGDGLGRR